MTTRSNSEADDLRRGGISVMVHNGVLDAGTHLLPKPFSIDDLAAKVRSILDEF
jgi:hypothetical protein